MGNTQSPPNLNWQRNYTILERNFSDNTIILKKNQGAAEYISRQIIITDNKQLQQINRLIQCKYRRNNPFLTKLAQVYHSNQSGVCSPEQIVYLIFEKPRQTLRQEILARKFANQPFSQQQADIILQSGIKAIKSLKQMNHPHNNISTSSIYINDDRRILLGDPWITSRSQTLNINQNIYSCPSPQKILYQNDQIMSICPFKSDIFSLGTVVLQAIYFEHMDVLYEKGFRRLLQSKVNQKLSKIANQNLRYKLSVVLSYDPNNRQQIYKLYKTSGIAVSQIKNKVTNNNNLVNNPHKIKVASEQNLIKNNQTQSTPTHTHTQSYLNNYVNTNDYPNMKSKSVPKIDAKTNAPINSNISNQNYNQSTKPFYIMNTPPPSNLNMPFKINNLSRVQHRVDRQTYGNVPDFNNQYHPSVNNYNSTAYRIGTSQNISGNMHNFKTTPNVNINYMKPYQNNNENVMFSRNDQLIPLNVLNTQAYPNLKQQNKSLPALSFDKVQNNLGILTQSNYNYNNFEPTFIKTNDDFVKNSGSLKYIEGLSKSNGLNTSCQQQNQNVQVGNYGLNNNSNVVFKITPKESEQFIIVKQHYQYNTHEAVSSNQNRGQQNTSNQSQSQANKYLKSVRQTPDRRPNRKYNSTIKQEPDEYSYSRQQEEGYDYVIQEYDTGKYEGQKKNGMRNGFGKFVYSEGSVYEGNWKDNLMHGKGCLYYSNGKLAYEGDWRMDQFHGFGKVYNQDQIIIKTAYDYKDFTDINDYWVTYEGELNSDRRHGKGKVKFSNGQIFSGTFIADVVEGEGKFYKTNGQIIHGLWKNNKLVKIF